MMHVTVILINDGYASTALGPVEIFHAAGSLWQVLKEDEADPRFDITVASIDGKSVTTPYSVAVSPHKSIHDIEHTDIVIVPSVGLELDAHVPRHAALIPWLQEWHAKGSYVAGVCTGAAYLAEAGLLDGRRGTTHWAVADVYRRRYPKVDWQPDFMITEEARLLCSGGVSASVDLSLYMVEKFCGREVALQCAKSLLVNMPRSHQSGYAVVPMSRPHTDKQIRTVEAFMEKNYARDLSIELLADRAGMSARTFVRRFKAATGKVPGGYLQGIRIAVAKEMLEEGARSVQAVSSAVGYEDIAFFRALFKRNTGMTPGDYRNTFGRTEVRAAAP